MVDSVYYLFCICKMGLDLDKMVVVDFSIRVYGIEGFRVVDVFIMLSVVSGNFNVFIIMIVEKIVDIIIGNKFFFRVSVFVYKFKSFDFQR